VKKERKKGDLIVWNSQPISWLITITHMFKHRGHNNNLQDCHRPLCPKITTTTTHRVNNESNPYYNNNDNIKPLPLLTSLAELGVRSSF
jgi:hypothetical protein